MQKLLVTALLCTFGALTLVACPGHEEFQAATGIAVDTPEPKAYKPNIQVQGNNLNYEEDFVEDDIGDIYDPNMDPNMG